MRYRELGKTHLRISEIGFGCGNLGGLMVRGSYEDQIRAVQQAINLGVNYFDTAAQYGDGRSETNLGRVLQELQPQNVVVATKVGLRPEDLGDVRGAIHQSLTDSLSRLSRNSVDVFLLHSQIALSRGGFRSGTLGVEDVLGEDGIADIFDELRAQGLVRFIGLTGLGETAALHQIVASGRFDMIQVYYNLLNPSAGIAVPAGFIGHDFKLLLEETSENEMGVAVIRVLAGGALGGKVARQGYAAPRLRNALVDGAEYEADEERATKLRFLIADEIRSLPQAGIRFALMHPAVSTILVGFSNLLQLKEAVSCSVEAPFPKARLNDLLDLWATDFGRT